MGQEKAKGKRQKAKFQFVIQNISRGFSLIELMVVIAIIGIVSAVGAGSVMVIQKNSRDTQRISDLNNLKSALQQYYADEQRYPNTLQTELANGSALTNCSGFATNPPCTVTKTYLNKTPKDPNSQSYFYRPVLSSSQLDNSCGISGGLEVGQCHYYILCAKLESPPAGSTCFDGNFNFSVTPL